MTNSLFNVNHKNRQIKNNVLSTLFMFATLIAVVFLIVLITSIVNDSFGYVVMLDEIDRDTLVQDGVNIGNQSKEQLLLTIEDNLSLRRTRALNREQKISERSQEDLYDIVMTEIVKPRCIASYSLFDSMFNRSKIIEKHAADKNAFVIFRSWISIDFLTSSQTSDPFTSGISGAIKGSFLIIALAILIAFPVGLASAIWLTEYAKTNKLSSFIKLNIHNLAGVPSIIYGMLGLAFFVRVLQPFTSGSMFGKIDDVNGRTILSASLTIATLILPVIIINAQEAILAVPASLRHASLALGATKWQTIRHHVLLNSMDRILTGTVLALSRGIGETAPLIMAGASTFLTKDPSGIFSKYTTLPIQIYQWAARPQAEFKRIAAAAIIALLVLMLTLNATAIITRNNLRKKKEI